MAGLYTEMVGLQRKSSTLFISRGERRAGVGPGEPSPQACLPLICAEPSYLDPTLSRQTPKVRGSYLFLPGDTWMCFQFLV